MEKIDGHKLLNFASQIDDNTIEQAKGTASMPFVHPHVALTPDAHSGKGTVIPTLDAVIPAAVDRYPFTAARIAVLEELAGCGGPIGSPIRTWRSCRRAPGSSPAISGNWRGRSVSRWRTGSR